MTVDTQKLLSLFDTAAQAHGWASDQGTKAQAQTALTNYQHARTELEKAIDALRAENARLRAQLEWTERYATDSAKTRSRDVDDWQGDMQHIANSARAALQEPK